MTETFQVHVPSKAFPGRTELATLTVEQRTDRTLRLTTPFSLKDEVKAMVGASWKKEARAWDVRDCRRNRLQLETLRGLTPPEHVRYLRPVVRATPRRAGCMVHQVDLLSFGLTRGRCVWAADTGTGKTLTAIEALEAVVPEGRDDTVWYVAPKQVLATVQLEFAKWDTKIRPRWLTYEALRSVVQSWPAGKRAPRALVFDECSRLKNPGSQTSEAAQHLADANRLEHGDQGLLIEMSGTVAPQDHTDWWSPTEIACPGWLRESTREKLEQRLGLFERQEAGGRVFFKRVGWRQAEVDLLPRRLAGVVKVMRQEDTAMHLPPPRRETVTCPISPETARAAFLVATLSEHAGRVKDKLRQLSDGFQYGDESDAGVREPTRRLERSPKDDALRTLLATYEDAGRFVIYAAYTASVDRCADLAVAAGWTVLRVDGRGHALLGPSRGYTERTALAAFARGGDADDRLAYVGHPSAGGMGANLQGAPALCWFSNTYKAEDRIQGEGRLRRPGMDVARGCVFYDLVHLGLDQLVIDRVREKRDALDLSLAEIRRATPG